MYAANLTFFLTFLLAIILAVVVFKAISPLLYERNCGRSLKRVVDSLKTHWLFGHLLSIQPNHDTLLRMANETAVRPKVSQLWFGPIVSYLILLHPHLLKPMLSTADLTLQCSSLHVPDFICFTSAYHINTKPDASSLDWTTTMGFLGYAICANVLEVASKEPKDDLAYRFLRPWIGDGLLVSSGKKWHRNRHLLTRAFHFDVLKEYVKVFNGCADIFLRKWESIDDGRPVEIYKDVSCLTLDAMLKCSISCDTGCQNQGSKVQSVFHKDETIHRPVQEPNQEPTNMRLPTLRSYLLSHSGLSNYHCGDPVLLKMHGLSSFVLVWQINAKSDHGYISAVFSLTTIIMNRMFNPLCYSDFVFNLTPNGRKFKTSCEYIHEYDEKVISARKFELKQLLEHSTDYSNSDLNKDDIARIAEIRRERGQWLDLLDILLLTRDEDGRGLSDREIRDEVDTFLFEGHDTTASGISWALYCLATYPKEQEKCRQELIDVVGNTNNIEWNDLTKLTKLSLFVKEVLRLYPPVFSISRRLANPVKFPRGFADDQFCLEDTPTNPGSCSRTIGPNHNIGLPIFTVHRNESLWDDPSVFDPSRFEKSNASKRSPFAYIPFSAGPRNCIGQNFALNEMKIVLSKILLRYRLFVDKDCSKPKMMPMIVLKSLNGIYIKFQKLS